MNKVWEYREFYGPIDELNKLGFEGWEVVGVLERNMIQEYENDTHEADERERNGMPPIVTSIEFWWRALLKREAKL